MRNNKEFLTGISPTWCPGCGNFGILTGLRLALKKSGLTPEETVVSYDIGCGANMGGFLRTSSFLGLHGRAIPLACGVKLANPRLAVLAVGGDGGLLGEGGNHLIHASRRNDDITVLISNNHLFSLTTGQASPTSPKGLKTKTFPEGSEILPVDPVALGLVSGASFVARLFAGQVELMAKVIGQAIRHKGFSLVEILSPCVTFDKDYTFAWYRQHTHIIKRPFPSTDKALKGSRADKKGFPLGIFFRERRKTFDKIVSKEKLPNKNITPLLRLFR